MSNILQILTVRGTLANVVPGRMIRIDPELYAPSSRVSPVSVGQPDFPATHRPPLAPSEVNLSSGFHLVSIEDNPASAYFGCFYAQNISEFIRDMIWEATWRYTTQLEHTTAIQPIQTTVGPNGEAGGSAAGVHPIAIQGTNVIYDTQLLVANNPNIEEINNQHIILQSSTTIYLPALGPEQHGMEVTIKNYAFLGTQIILTQAPVTIDRVGYPPVGFVIPGDGTPGAANQFILDAANYWPGSVTLVYDHYAQNNPNWICKTHDHIARDPSPLSP